MILKIIFQVKWKNNIILLGCNAGHVDHLFTNIAYCLRKKVKGPVIASDGTVASYGDISAKANDTFDSEADKEWGNHRTNRNGYGFRSKNYGWVKYVSSSNIVYTGIYFATIKQLCKV